MGTLSGGQRRRVDLARLLVGDWDVLALDEPTNHLDVRAITWLANHLKGRWSPAARARFWWSRTTAGFWTRYARACGRCTTGTVEPFEGGFSAYILQRVERDRLAALAEQKRQNAAAPRARRGSPAAARARATKPKFHVKLPPRRSSPTCRRLRNELELKRMAMARLGKQVVDLEQATRALPAHGRGERAPIARCSTDVDWIIGPGDRYGIVGRQRRGQDDAAAA